MSGSNLLALGCGEVRTPGAVHVDRNPANKPEVVHDLDAFPWPFEDGRFEAVLAEHVLEHLNEPDRVLREIHRISKPGALLTIITPHYSSPESWNDLTHRYHFGLVAFKPYYAAKYGTPKLFDLVSRKLYFGKSPLSWPGRLASLVSLDCYEKYLAFAFPARNMRIVLRVLKD